MIRGIFVSHETRNSPSAGLALFLLLTVCCLGKADAEKTKERKKRWREGIGWREKEGGKKKGRETRREGGNSHLLDHAFTAPKSILG